MDLTPRDRHRLRKAFAPYRLASAKIDVAALNATEAAQRFNIAARRAMEAADIAAVEEVHRLALARRARN